MSVPPRRFTVWALFAVVLAFGAAQPSPTLAANPTFAVDASWPKPLPEVKDSNGVNHRWVAGEIAGTCADQNDHIYTVNRGWEVGVTVGGVLQGNESGAIDGQDATASAIPSPPILAYDTVGNVVTSFGNPTLNQTGPSYGYPVYMAHGSHGCYVDFEGNLWVGGNGDGIVQKYNPVTANAQGAAATFTMQIGTKGVCDSPPVTGNTYLSCSETTDLNTSHTLLNEPADIAVDPQKDPVTGKKGDVYIADGYGNHRIVVFDSTGKYVRQWGTACMIPNSSGVLAPGIGLSCPPGSFGATGGGHPHCVVLGNDGLVYVCDRPDDRIQVFEKNCGAASTAAVPQPVCFPVQIINISGFDKAKPADEAAILLAGTRGDDMDFWPNIDYLASKSPTKQNIIIDVDLGNDNVWLLKKATGEVFGALGVCGIAPCPGHNAGQFAFAHTVSQDSTGSIYIAETITGRRIQKFVQTNGD